MKKVWTTPKQIRSIQQNLCFCRQDSNKSDIYKSMTYKFSVSISFSKMTITFINTIMPNVLTNIILDYISVIDVFYTYNKERGITYVHYYTNDGVNENIYDVDHIVYIFKRTKASTIQKLVEKILL